MILGVQLHGLLAKSSKKTEELLLELRQIGYEGIEPCITMEKESNHVSYWSCTDFEQLYSYISELGLSVNSCHVFSKNLLSDMSKICNLAKNYRIKHIIVKMPDDLSDVGLQEAAFTYRRLGEALEQAGARLLIHNGKREFISKVHERTAYEYMVDICLGSVGMQLDVGWAMVAGEDVIDFLKRNEARIESIHFKDFTDLLSEEKETTVGTGCLDSELIMQFGRAKGLPLVVDQDVFENPMDDIKKSFWYLMDAGSKRAHSVSYLNVYDTQTDEVKLIQKFDGVIEAPNWVDTKNSLMYNQDGAIYQFDLSTKESKKIYSGLAINCNNDHVVSADETEIAVSSDYETEEGGGSRIFILPIDGGEAKLITKHAPSYLHGWSPDKKELAYCAFRQVDGRMAVDVYSISTDGGEEKRLTREGFNDGPEYSPDGKHIWFISTKSGLMQVYRMNRDGSDIRQMTFEEQNNWFGHVSPDGKRVVNLAYRKGDLQPAEHLPNMQVELWMMDYDGNNRKKLLTFFGGQGSINVNSWSKDSRYFAFVSYGIEL